ncbi:MAG: hypothetical protein GXY76_11300 [Chloroflexi bacterium]|nr:hypothetical protein [Chloroflexota bacterium]
MLIELERPTHISCHDLLIKNLKRRAKVPALLVLAVAALGLLGLPYLLLDSRVYHYTAQLKSYNAQKEDLVQLNNERRHEIAQWESIARIESDAIKLGFRIPDQFEVVAVGYSTPSQPSLTLGQQVAANAGAVTQDIAARWSSLKAWQSNVFGKVQQWLDRPTSP